MDSPSAAASPEVFMSSEELLEEIAFQKTLLQTIDDSVEHREQAEDAVKTEIRELEKQLRALRKDQHKPLSVASLPLHNNHTNSTSRPNPTLSYNDDDSFGSLIASISAAQSMATISSSTNSTPMSGTSMSHELLSPALPSRKRPLNTSLTNESGNKSRRTSPSPHITRSTTPSSGSGYDYPVTDAGFYDLTTDDDLSNRLLQRQKDAEDRASRERADAELARQLANESADDSGSSSSGPLRHVQNASQRGPSAFDRLLGRPQYPNQPPFGRSSFNRTPQLSQSNAAHASTYGSAPMTQPYNPTPSMASKTGSKFAPRMKIPGAFPRESSVDSDSDIEVIPPTAFHDNGRRTNAAVTAPNGSVYTSRLYPPTQYPSSNSHGLSLPSVAGMGLQQTSKTPMGYNPFSNNPVYQSGSFPPAGSGGLSNLDPLRAMIHKTSNIAWNPRAGVYQGVSGSSIYPSSFPTNLQDLGLGNMSESYYGRTLDGRALELSDYINDPRKTAEEIKALLDNIRPDEEIPKENREGTPEGLKYALYEHQKLALAWLKSMEEGSNKGSILADDMGLGKTISALALVLSRPSPDRARKTTLIVGPVALVRQWEREIQSKIKRSHSLSTYLYHSGKKAPFATLRNFDIVLTTYGTIGAERKRLDLWEEKLSQNPDMDQSSYSQRFPFLGTTSKWYRVILDEAQCIKNKSTNAAKGCVYLKSITRLCLTGTPMMNGVHELYSLIHFLRIRPYNEFTKFNQDFACLWKNSSSYSHETSTRSAMKRLQAVLKAILLRRTKTSKIDGKDILTLPPKTEEIVHAVFNEHEDEYYKGLENKTKLQFNKYVRAGTIGKNYSNILVLLLRLRQAACHPHLIMDFEEAPSEMSVEDMAILAKTLQPDVIARIIAATFPFECPVCYDPVINPRIVVPCGHDTCADCLVRIAGTGEQEGLADGNDAAQSTAKCPTCRGKIDMKKIIDYETFKTVHMHVAPNQKHEETESEDDNSTDGDSLGSDSELESDEDSDGDIRDFVVPDTYVSEDEVDEDDTEVATNAKIKNLKTDPDVTEEAKIKAELRDEDSDEDFIDIKDIPVSKTKVVAKAKKINAKKSQIAKKPKKHRGKGRGKGKGKGKGKEKEKDSYLSLARLKKEASKSAEGKRRYMKQLRKNWESSAKVDKCLEILQNTETSRKTIIFSQFTTLLDLIEVPLRREKIGLVRYDGSMSADARHAAVVNFTDDPRCKVMLCSLKAGNAGLNLVAASQVIILDPFWNPYVEMQAVDRAHRIGQQNPVNVHRIIVAGTVEDRIIELQNKKRKLIEAALDEKASQGLGRLGMEELVYLFNGGGDRETAARPALTFGSLHNHGRHLNTPSPTPSASSTYSSM